MISRKRFYIPMFIILGIASLAFLVFAFFAFVIAKEIIEAADLGTVFAILFSSVIMIPAGFISMVLAIPIISLSCNFLRRIRGTSIEKFPSIISLVLGILYISVPPLYILILQIL